METYADDASATIATNEQGGFGVHTFVNIVTRNPVKSAADTDMLGIIFFGLLFGAALTQLKPEVAKPMIDVLQALKLKPRHGFRYSIEELSGAGEEMDRQIELAASVPAGKRTLTQKKFVEFRAEARHDSDDDRGLQPAATRWHDAG